MPAKNQPSADLADSTAASRRIVLLGASVRAAAQSAAGAGWDVYGVDLYGDVDTQRLCVESVRVAPWRPLVADPPPTETPGGQLQANNGHDPSLSDPPFRRLSEAATRWTCQGIPWLWVGYVAHPEILKWFPRGGQVPTIGKDPDSLTQFSVACGLVPIETHEVVSGLPSLGPWLIKPRSGSGGIGVHRWDAATAMPIVAKKHFVQAEVLGTAIGATCLADADHVRIVGVCRSLQRGGGHRPYAYAGSEGPVHVCDQVRSSLQRIADEFVRRHSFRGLFNVDAIIEPVDGPAGRRVRLLEINPRMGASTELVERGLGISLVDLAIRIRLGESIDWDTIPDRFTTAFRKRILYADQPMAFDFQTMVDRHGPPSQIYDVPRDGQWHQADEPLCTVIEPISDPPSA